MKKFTEYLEEAEKITKAVDHLLYLTFPLFKEKKILIKILIEIKKSFAYNINAILQYEYLLKRVQLYKDPKLNFKTFLNKCSPKYNISEEETKKIQELFQIIQNHKKSSMEFTRNGNLIIITDKETKSIKIQEIKEFLKLSKKLIQSTQDKILRKI